MAMRSTGFSSTRSSAAGSSEVTSAFGEGIGSCLIVARAASCSLLRPSHVETGMPDRGFVGKATGHEVGNRTEGTTVGRSVDSEAVATPRASYSSCPDSCARRSSQRPMQEAIDQRMTPYKQRMTKGLDRQMVYTEEELERLIQHLVDGDMAYTEGEYHSARVEILQKSKEARWAGVVNVEHIVAADVAGTASSRPGRLSHPNRCARRSSQLFNHSMCWGKGQRATRKRDSRIVAYASKSESMPEPGGFRRHQSDTNRPLAQNVEEGFRLRRCDPVRAGNVLQHLGDNLLNLMNHE